MIIGLSGAAGCGKDALANYFTMQKGSAKYAFSGPLKHGLSAMFNIPMLDIEDPKVKNAADYKFGRSIRYMMQLLGTEFGRNMVASDVWIQVAQENLEELQKHNKVIICTDCRFDNEADLIHSMGGKVIKIIRSNNPHTDALISAGGITAHASEAGLLPENIDYVIHNDHSMDMFLEEGLIAFTKLFN